MGLHPLLFAAYAVLFLFSQNLDEVTLRDAIVPLGRAVIWASLAVMVPALLLRDIRRGALIGTAAVAVFFGYGHLKNNLAEHGYSTDVLHVILGAVVVVMIFLALWLRRDRLAGLTRGLDVIALVLVAMTLVSIVPHEFSRVAFAGEEVPGRGEPVPGDRDVYWLIFDRYGSADGIRRFTGYDNPMPAWLASRGFHVADEAKSNYVRTTLSLTAALKMDYLDDIAARMDPASDDLGPAYEIINHHEPARVLRGRGYRYIHVGSWFGPTRSHPLADLVPDPETETDFSAVLDETTVLPLVREWQPPEEAIKETDLVHREAGLFQWRALDDVRTLPGPKFVMAHVLLPHMPYVFDADGSYPSADERDDPESEMFVRQLKYTNAKIQEFVTDLLAVPDDQKPIIIIQADEGPAPAPYAADLAFDWDDATQDELHTKYGIISAFYFPPGVDRGTEPLPENIGPVNTFRVLFSRAFGMDYPLLEERQYTSEAWLRPWDFTDRTEQLSRP